MSMNAEKQRAYAAKILKKADTLLAEVDNSYIVTETDHEKRDLAYFRPEEITLGAVLGRGGFGVVNEISGFCLDEVPEEQNDKESEGQVENIPANENGDDGAEKDNQDNPAKANIATKNRREKQDSLYGHYDANEARELMRDRVQKNNHSRYALKRLHDDLTEVEQARGMIDLAIEAKFLSIVWHPNISEYRLRCIFVDGRDFSNSFSTHYSQNKRYCKGAIGRHGLFHRYGSSSRNA